MKISRIGMGLDMGTGMGMIICVVVLLTLAHGAMASGRQNETDVPRARTAQSPLAGTDEYVARNQERCLERRSLLSCLKYRASKLVWKLATNGLGLFANEQGRELTDDKRRWRLIQLNEPAAMAVFADARSLPGDSELTSVFKFLKRAVETFARSHGLELSLSADSGLQVRDADMDSRGHKKRRKWLIILPLIILLKLAHLKTTVVTLLLGVLGLNVLLVGGTGWLIHYLKYKTLCKIHPHLVQTHSHVYDSDPAEYSTFVGSSFPGSYHSSAGGSPHEISPLGYSKDWASSKAYSGYNYLDTISRRLQA